MNSSHENDVTFQDISQSENHPAIILIPDTSFLLNCNDQFLRQLAALPHSHYSVRLIVPWKVLKELESLSHNIKKTDILRSNASRLSSFLMHLMLDTESCIYGQKLNETWLNLNENLHVKPLHLFF